MSPLEFSWMQGFVFFILGAFAPGILKWIFCKRTANNLIRNDPNLEEILIEGGSSLSNHCTMNTFHNPIFGPWEEHPHNTNLCIVECTPPSMFRLGSAPVSRATTGRMVQFKCMIPSEESTMLCEALIPALACPVKAPARSQVRIPAATRSNVQFCEAMNSGALPYYLSNLECLRSLWTLYLENCKDLTNLLDSISNLSKLQYYMSFKNPQLRELQGLD